jgi:tetratricopeptide (TPR) repeat protein
MRLFARPTMTDEERRRCLAYHDEQLRVAAFLDRERRLLDGTLDECWPAVSHSPEAAGELCRASDRFRQAAEEAVRRQEMIQSVPAAASRFHAAESAHFSWTSAWAKANLAVMETLAQGRPPFYVPFERLEGEAASAWQEARETYRSFRRCLGLAAGEADALQKALRTHDFEEAGVDEWRPEPYTRDFREVQSRILQSQNDGSQVTADIMTHYPVARTNPRTNANLDCRDEVPGLHGPDPAALHNEGCGLTASGRHDEAIACYDRILEIDAGDAMAWFNKGVNLAAMDRRREAVECFDRALAIDPRDETAWCAKGVNLAVLDRHEEAIDCCEKALEIDAQCVGAWCAKGVGLANRDRHEEAVACFDEALEIDPSLAPVWSNKGDCLTTLGRHEEAVVCCESALAIEPQDEAAWFNKGIGLAALGRHEEAIACFDKALNIDPRLAQAWSRKGNSLTVLRRPEEAVGCYARAVRIEPRDAAAWYNKALREESCGHTEDAAESYRQFLEVAPPKYADLIAAARQKIEALGGRGS